MLSTAMIYKAADDWERQLWHIKAIHSEGGITMLQKLLYRKSFFEPP